MENIDFIEFDMIINGWNWPSMFVTTALQRPAKGCWQYIGFNR